MKKFLISAIIILLLGGVCSAGNTIKPIMVSFGRDSQVEARSINLKSVNFYSDTVADKINVYATENYLGGLTQAELLFEVSAVTANSSISYYPNGADGVDIPKGLYIDSTSTSGNSITTVVYDY